MLLITSFNQNLYEAYGKRMCQEFSEKSDGSVKLAVVFEGEANPTATFENVEFILFNNIDHKTFMSKFAHLHEARGLRIKFQPNNQVNLSWDYRFDAVKFSFKIFSILQTLEAHSSVDHFAWIDADIRCLKNFTKNDLMPFFPDENQLMSYLGRKNFPLPNAYSECGFLGFNRKHPLVLKYLTRVAQIYRDGEIFSQVEWHDSWVWDKVREKFESEGVEFKNISGSFDNTDHPFINTGLGKFFDHLKGPMRKQLGRSMAEDYETFKRIP